MSHTKKRETFAGDALFVWKNNYLYRKKDKIKMAKQRIIDVKFWDDKYIRKINKDEKLLFLYCLTNPLTDICGIYEISLDRIKFDTALEHNLTKKIFKKFEKDGKMIYREDWLGIKNFIKNQKPTKSILLGIENSLKRISKRIHDTLGTGWGEGGGTVFGYNIKIIEYKDKEKESDFFPLIGSTIIFNKNEPAEKGVKLFYLKDPMVFKAAEKKWYTIKNNEWFAFAGTKADEKDICYKLS